MSKINNKQVSSGITWASSKYGEVFFDAEAPRLEAGLRQAIGPCTLQIGSMLDEGLIRGLDLPQLIKMQLGPKPSLHSSHVADLAGDPAYLPFSEESFSTVVLPHVLETHFTPHQVLREVHRVLRSEGYVVVTGLSPSSLVGLQRLIRPKSALPGKYYTPSRVIDWLRVLGFEVVASSMFQYAPLSSKPKVNSMFNFFESVGDRWLPMFGAGYMITAKKKEFGGTMVGRFKFSKRSAKLATARASINSKQDVNSDSLENS